MSSPVVLVTGGNQGLGLGILQVLTQRQPSWQYLLGSRNVGAGQDAAAQLAAAIPHLSIAVLELDVTNDEHIGKAVQQIEQTHGRLDLLINNAGILRPANHATLTLRQIYDATLSVNLTSVGVLTTALLPLLHRAPAPRVINVTSGTASLARQLSTKVPHVPTYGASKTGLNGVTVHMQGVEWDRVAAAELEGTAPGGTVRFYVVQPGVTRTGFTRYTIGKDPKDGAEVVVRLAVDDKGTYPGGTYWQFEEGEMSEVPW